MDSSQENKFCKLEMIEGGIYVLLFTGDSQHRFTPVSILLIHDLLDQVLSDQSACALITANEGKYYSTGMDVDYMRKHDKKTTIEYLFMFQRLVSRLLTFSIPTIAIIRGHAVGAGCIFALAHDSRLMLSNHSYIFMNEVNIGLSLTPGNMALLASKLPKSVFQEAVLTGKKYDGHSAAAAGLVQEGYAEGTTILERGISIASNCKSKNWKRDVYHALKIEMYKDAVKELEAGGIGYARM